MKLRGCVTSALINLLFVLSNGVRNNWLNKTIKCSLMHPLIFLWEEEIFLQRTETKLILQYYSILNNFFSYVIHATGIGLVNIEINGTFFNSERHM